VVGGGTRHDTRGGGCRLLTVVGCAHTERERERDKHTLQHRPPHNNHTTRCTGTTSTVLASSIRKSELVGLTVPGIGIVCASQSMVMSDE
jgi:hypothetical protein